MERQQRRIDWNVVNNSCRGYINQNIWHTIIHAATSTSGSEGKKTDAEADGGGDDDDDYNNDYDTDDDGGVGSDNNNDDDD